MNKKFQEKKIITSEGYSRLIEELKNKKEKLIDLSRRATECRIETTERTDSAVVSFLGQLSDLGSEISSLEREIKNVEVKDIDPEASANVASIGDDVSIVFKGDEEDVMSFTLVDLRPKLGSEISVESPLGAAVYNQPVGAIREFKTPIGTTEQITILNITKPNNRTRK